MHALPSHQLKEKWVSEKLKLNTGVTDIALQLFEENYKVKIPVDLRKFYLLANGMEMNETDADLIRFWSIEELKPISEAASAYFDHDYLQSVETYFLFADYSIWSHTYAISLTSSLSSENTICVIGANQPIFLANSFSEFINKYLDGKVLEFLKS